MSDTSPRPQRQAPRERFSGEEHLFDLAAEGEAIRAEPGAARDGHRQITLFRADGLSVVLFEFDAGGWLTDHSADGYVTVNVLAGEIEMTTPEGVHSMPAGTLLVLRPGVRHDVRAKVASRMLLGVHLVPDQD